MNVSVEHVDDPGYDTNTSEGDWESELFDNITCASTEKRSSLAYIPSVSECDKVQRRFLCATAALKRRYGVDVASLESHPLSRGGVPTLKSLAEATLVNSSYAMVGKSLLPHPLHRLLGESFPTPWTHHKKLCTVKTHTGV